MPSNAQKGQYYKQRAKQWLIRKGWQVADLERVHHVWTPKGRIGIKKDQFASDLLAVSAKRVMFVQVKGGITAASGNFPEAQRAFNAFVFPPQVGRVILAFAPRAKAPRVIVVPG